MVRLIVFALVLILPLGAVAKTVFLNGVMINGVRDQTFNQATVKIDSEGNIHIDAPGYQVAGTGSTPKSASQDISKESTDEGVVSNRYYLVSQQTKVGAAQYRVDVYVNSRWIRSIRSDDSQLVVDLTEYLRKGTNRVLIEAKKSIDNERRSYSPEHIHRVVIGEGNMGGNRVVIDRPLISFEAAANQMEDISREFELNAR